MLAPKNKIIKVGVKRREESDQEGIQVVVIHGTLIDGGINQMW